MLITQRELFVLKLRWITRKHGRKFNVTSFLYQDKLDTIKSFADKELFIGLPFSIWRSLLFPVAMQLKPQRLSGLMQLVTLKRLNIHSLTELH